MAPSSSQLRKTASSIFESCQAPTAPNPPAPSTYGRIVADRTPPHLLPRAASIAAASAAWARFARSAVASSSTRAASTCVMAWSCASPGGSCGWSIASVQTRLAARDANLMGLPSEASFPRYRPAARRRLRRFHRKPALRARSRAANTVLSASQVRGASDATFRNGGRARPDGGQHQLERFRILPAVGATDSPVGSSDSSGTSSRAFGMPNSQALSERRSPPLRYTQSFLAQINPQCRARAKAL